MAELIAVIHPEGQGGQARAALQELAGRHQLTMLDAGFAEQLCGALGASGTLTLFVAKDGAAGRDALHGHSAIVLQTQLGDEALEMAAGTHNLQLQGEERRESGGESTRDSGQ